MQKNLKDTKMIVAVGSVDGVLTTAALLRYLGDATIPVVFTQAFQVKDIDMSKWAPNCKVTFVDLAVNNQDPKMTADFVAHMTAAGHELVAVLDEHDGDLWKQVLGEAIHDLAIQPVTGKGTQTNSSGALLAQVIGLVDDHFAQLCYQADEGDRMVFTGSFGRPTNMAIKANISDNARREYMARYFAQNSDPDEKILGWVREYEEILRNHTEILAAKVDLGDNMVRIDATGKRIDMTSLMAGLYKSGAKVVVLLGEAYNQTKKVKEITVSYGAADANLDILGLCKAAGLNPVGGKGPKVNFEPGDEVKATEVVRKILQWQKVLEVIKVFEFTASMPGMTVTEDGRFVVYYRDSQTGPYKFFEVTMNGFNSIEPLFE